MKHTLLFLFIASAVAQCPAESEAAQRILRCANTTSGWVAGHPAPKNPSVYEYLGIPFAQPPLGNLRFAPPKAYVGTGFINGTNFGYTCPKLLADALSFIPQNFPDVASNYTASGISIIDAFSQVGDAARNHEDCLTLNIWTRARAGEEKKAVMIWIYGGAFLNGNTANPVYDGSTLVNDEDVIMVSINYRVNIFGFSGDSTGPTSNYGMLDQRLAIEWVHENIARFGGDPTRITTFGQSAGSCSIDYYSYAYPKDPIVNSMIMQSGNIPSLPTLTPSQAFANWRNISTSLGCGDASHDPTLTIQCMRNPNLTTASILEIAHLHTWLPSIDNTLVFPDYPTRAAAGNLANIPLLIGSTNNEAAIFAAQIPMSHQPAQDWSLITNQTFACPAAARANLSAALGAKTWRYRYFGDFPNLQLQRGVEAGAFHISDVYTLFGTWPAGTGIPAPTTQEVELGRYMRGAWAAFAKDSQRGLLTYRGGDWEVEKEEENADRAPLQRGWPNYKPGVATMARLGFENQVGIILDRPELYDSAC
ncbi:hypothetical protein DSL72_005981 [Monilinia vaccinii-corymbosi]|uniref:Carboxylesterase type B domain-containing protein n=1 Tax=Monilinia vaccinii-corymbosi TaxID=61207 RepID=A0A8A3PH80_9HELO|nr:hypothetical protein DSL72_005981 [Monilinia vaccinii-corymbosi]